MGYYQPVFQEKLPYSFTSFEGVSLGYSLPIFEEKLPYSFTSFEEVIPKATAVKFVIGASPLFTIVGGVIRTATMPSIEAAGVLNILPSIWKNSAANLTSRTLLSDMMGGLLEDMTGEVREPMDVTSLFDVVSNVIKSTSFPINAEATFNVLPGAAIYSFFQVLEAGATVSVTAHRIRTGTLLSLNTGISFTAISNIWKNSSVIFTTKTGFAIDSRYDMTGELLEDMKGSVRAHMTSLFNISPSIWKNSAANLTSRDVRLDRIGGLLENMTGEVREPMDVTSLFDVVGSTSFYPILGLVEAGIAMTMEPNRIRNTGNLLIEAEAEVLIAAEVNLETNTRYDMTGRILVAMSGIYRKPMLL